VPMQPAAATTPRADIQLARARGESRSKSTMTVSALSVRT
jgi:hypothetical protein